MPDLTDVSDLSEQLRDYVDGIAPVITLDELTGEESCVAVDLAPNVDRRRRRAWVAIAAAAAVAAVVGGLLIGLRPDGVGELRIDPATTSPTSPAPALDPQPEFEVVFRHDSSPEPLGTLRAAVDDEGYRTMLGALKGRGLAIGSVDFERWIVVSITIPDDACPPTLEGFDRDGSTWTPRLVEPTEMCNEPLIPRTFVVAINRGEVTPAFTLRLPGQPTYGFDEQLLRVDVPDLSGSSTATSTPTTTRAAPPEDAAPITTGTTRPPLVRDLAEADLTQPWGCGTGFAATNADRTVAVFLRASAQRPAAGPTVQLPSAGWTAEVQFGRDLFAVPCQDGDFRANPAPTETWPITAGTLTVNTPSTGACGNPLAATAVLEQATVVAPDGTTITLPTVTITHHDWGCSPG